MRGIHGCVNRLVRIVLILTVLGGTAAAVLPLVETVTAAQPHAHHAKPEAIRSATAYRLSGPTTTTLAIGLSITALATWAVVRRIRRRRVSASHVTTSSTPRLQTAIDHDRRRLIRYGTAGVVATGVGGVSLWRMQSTPAADTTLSTASLLSDNIAPCFDNSPLGPPFTQPLPIPPALNPIPSVPQATTDVYVISEMRGETEIVPGIRTPIWGYNGIFPGPTILARKGRPVSMTFTNQLPPAEEPSAIIITAPQDPTKHPFLDSSTVVHLHGLNSDHFSDGYPDDGDGHKHRVRPGELFTHVYPNNEYQRCATFWYHDHSVHVTSQHVYRGLAAFYILQDEEEDALRLPGSPLADPGRGYGVFDVPLLIKDVMIANQEIDGRPPGTLVYNNCSHMGAYGDIMTVNGKQQPRFDVANRKYRFRVLNGSDARQYLLSLRLATQVEDGPDQPFTVIGADQGLLTSPVPTTEFHITPAERFEIVIDFSPYPVGTRLILVNKLIEGFDPRLSPIMAFDVTRVEPDTSEVRPVLRPPEHPADFAAPVQVRTFLFNREGGYWSINGLQWDPARVDARPIVDTNEEWVLVNEAGGWGHPVHIHLGRFKIIEIKGRPPRPGELEGFKDTVWVGPNQTIRLVHQFWNFTGRFLFHCHNGSHEDHDMMTQFEVQPPPPATP
jgi:spore coat protein A, manganese oxidase